MLLAVCAPRGATASDPGAPINVFVGQILAAYGGESLPRRGQVIRQTGRNWSEMHGAEGRIVREFRWPDYLRVEIDYPDGSSESRLLDGIRIMRDGQPVPPAMASAMRLQLARLSLPMLLAWEAGRLSELAPTRRPDGIEVRRLRVDFDDGLALFAEVDRETARILRTAGVVQLGKESVSFGAEYDRFRFFGGLSWPEKEDLSAMGHGIGSVVLETIEIDPAPARDFLKP